MTTRGWQEILTNWDAFLLRGTFAPGEGAGLYELGANPPDGEGDPNLLWAYKMPESGKRTQWVPWWAFLESRGGRLLLRENGRQRLVTVDDGVVSQEADPKTAVSGSADWTEGSPLVIDEVSGQVVLAFEDRASGKPAYLAIGAKQGSLYPVVAVSDPTLPEAHWIVDERSDGAPADATMRWLYTYFPQNGFSPCSFMYHVSDTMQKTGFDSTGATSLTESLKTSINYKMGAGGWRAFPATTPLLRQEASGALLRASAKFYERSKDRYAARVPLKNPDWPAIDKELGSYPYPG